MDKHFSMTDEGSVEQYLGVKVERNNGSVKLSQPYLIEWIIDTIGGMQTSNANSMVPGSVKSCRNGNIYGAFWTDFSFLLPLRQHLRTFRTPEKTNVAVSATFLNERTLFLLIVFKISALEQKRTTRIIRRHFFSFFFIIFT